MRTPITYYGGKQSMLKYILPLIIAHTIYVEPFAGGAAVFWAKESSLVEVLNDTNKEVINFYQVLQKDFSALQKEVQATPHSREVHRQAQIVYENSNMFKPLQRAWAFWVLSCQSYSVSLVSGWRYGRSNKVESLIDKKRRNFTPELKERLSKVQIECNDALKAIKSRDTGETFFYCDPPYSNAVMGHYTGYTKEDFTSLLETLAHIKGKFLLSSYPSDVLTEYTDRYGWKTIEVNRDLAMRKVKNKTEVLIANYALHQTPVN